MLTEPDFATLSTGVRLAYAEQGEKDGTAVLMLHGLSDTLHSFDLLRPLLPRSWRVIAATQRGHGLSDKPEQGYAMPDFAADAVALLDALGIARAVVVGHSMSTAVTLQTAAQFPERVAGIALIGAFADCRSSASLGELEEIVGGLGEYADPQFAREFQESTLANPIPEAFLELAIAETLRMPSHAWRGAVAGMRAFDGVAAAQRCSAPAAIVWGEKDAYCLREDQLKLREALGSCRLFTLAGVGHAVHWERPAEVAALLRAFVAEIEDAARVAEDCAA